METVGSLKLKLFRTGKGLSYREMAKLVSVAHQSIYNWESGDKRPDVDSAVKLEKVTKGKVKVTDWTQGVEDAGNIRKKRA